ncbi:MAG: ABC transporter substrate-binding protein [Streptosporangiales bacterium]
MSDRSSMNNWANSQIDRRGFLRGIGLAGASLSAAGMATACGASGGGGGSEAKASPTPSYYPKNYESIIEGSKKEKELTIYSNVAEYNWRPIIDGFQAQYPWVKKISTNNLDSAEVFQRYYSESASGKSAASLMVSGDPISWRAFIEKHHAALEYKSPELDHLPDFGQPLPGLYTFSADPILMAYNKKLLKEGERPTGIGKLADMIAKDPDKFNNKVTTYDIAVSFGFAINYTWLKEKPNGWSLLEKMLPSVRPEQSSGPMVDKINTGEYLTGFFMSSTVVLPQAKKSGAILGWSYIDDGTPLFLRGMAVTKTAPQPNTAKLMLDYVLSHAGQIAVYEGGFTPYRSDVDVKRTYQAIMNEVGKDNVMIIGYDKVSEQQQEKIRDHWNSALGQ